MRKIDELGKDFDSKMVQWKKTGGTSKEDGKQPHCN
jgi:hypothetical protein